MAAPAAVRHSLGLPLLARVGGALVLVLSALHNTLAVTVPAVCGDRTVVDMTELGVNFFDAPAADVDSSKGLCILGTSSQDLIVGSNASDVIFGFQGKGGHVC